MIVHVLDLVFFVGLVHFVQIQNGAQLLRHSDTLLPQTVSVFYAKPVRYGM